MLEVSHLFQLGLGGREGGRERGRGKGGEGRDRGRDGQREGGTEFFLLHSYIMFP